MVQNSAAYTGKPQTEQTHFKSFDKNLDVFGGFCFASQSIQMKVMKERKTSTVYV
jgi:hypothetical protein